MNDLQTIEATPALASLITKTEYDVQIATANKYQRSIKNFLDEARQLVTLNEEVAAQCIYALPRGGKSIEGASARFAEIVASCWGNIRAGARIVDEDNRFITAQGVCHDLQKNVLITFEVRRKITDKYNKKYNDDMVVTTGNAAASIALRNAILKVVPKAFWQPLYEEAKKVAIGNAQTLSNRRELALETIQKMGVKRDDVFAYLEVKGIEDITLDHLAILRGNLTAIKEGDATVDDVFYPKKVTLKSNAPTNAVAALEAAAQPAQATQPYNADTGEIIEGDMPDMFEGATPTEEAKPFATLEQLIALPYTNQTQIKVLCKEAKRSIEGMAVTKLDFMQAFPDLPDAAKRVGAYPDFEKITKL
jgi:hypothetical protein